MGTVVVGREAELGAIEDLIGALGSGPTALVLEGEAGIGKTTVWDVGRDARSRHTSPSAGSRARR
jgi:hypothetical protein